MPDDEVLANSSPLWQHVKRGTLYRVIFQSGLLQCTGEMDQTPVVIYMSENGTIYVRPKIEFYDGRFVQLPGREP